MKLFKVTNCLTNASETIQGKNRAKAIRLAMQKLLTLDLNSKHLRFKKTNSVLLSGCVRDNKNPEYGDVYYPIIVGKVVTSRPFFVEELI